MYFRLFLYISIYYFNVSFSLTAQSTIREESLKFFNEGNYSQALPLFKRQVTLFPKDPIYQYYTGVCLVQANNNLNQAIDYLTFAADGPVPSDVYYFLGKAYHLRYKFKEAVESYLKFQRYGSKSLKDKWQCDMNLEMARNGNNLLGKQCVFEVYKTDTINSSNVFDFYNSFLKTGKFIEKSEKIFSFTESKYRNTWRFIPSSPDINQPVFESLYVGINHKNKDLVSIRKLSGNGWSSPANLGNIINSPYDEEYAYFNTVEHTLYFSSKGHNSMGGYDIFKSIYDSVNNTWSEPINLGYPINTPYDDFLFVPSDDQSQAYFCSNRETHDDRVIVYTISFSRNYETISPSVNIDYSSASDIHPVGMKRKAIINTAIPSENKINVTKPLVNNYPPELLNHGEYDRCISLAMQYQLQSDSMGRKAEILRQRIPSIKSEAERDQVKKEIYSLEKRSKESQIKADEYYDKSRILEKKYNGHNLYTDSGKYSKNDPVKDAFNPKSRETNTNKDTKADEVHEQIVNSNENKKIAVKVINDFTIMAKPYYSTLDQIPVNPPVIEGLIYRIQLGVFSKAVDPAGFKGMAPIVGEALQNGATKFYAGLFNRLSDAEKALNKVHDLGFKDAYIVSFFNGTYLPSNRAKQLEKDQK